MFCTCTLYLLLLENCKAIRNNDVSHTSKPAGWELSESQEAAAGGLVVVLNTACVGHTHKHTHTFSSINSRFAPPVGDSPRGVFTVGDCLNCQTLWWMCRERMPVCVCFSVLQSGNDVWVWGCFYVRVCVCSKLKLDGGWSKISRTKSFRGRCKRLETDAEVCLAATQWP